MVTGFALMFALASVAIASQWSALAAALTPVPGAALIAVAHSREIRRHPERAVRIRANSLATTVTVIGTFAFLFALVLILGDHGEEWTALALTAMLVMLTITDKLARPPRDRDSDGSLPYETVRDHVNHRT